MKSEKGFGFQRGCGWVGGITRLKYGIIEGLEIYEGGACDLFLVGGEGGSSE